MIKYTAEQTERVRQSYLKCHSCSTAFMSSSRETNNEIFIRIHPLLCHSPFCQKCNDIKVQNLFPKLISFAKQRTLRFMHLTYQADLGYQEVLRRYASDWNKFVTYLRRRRYKFNYFKIVEFTKRDIVHFHILIDCSIPHSLIKSYWYKITGSSYIVYITRVLKHRTALHECLKYITKSHHGKQSPYVSFRVRRFSFSRFTYDFVRGKDLGDSSWSFDFTIFKSEEDLKKFRSSLQAFDEKLHPDKIPKKLVFL